MFQNLRHQLVEVAQKSGDLDVPNLTKALVDIHQLSNEKKKGELVARRGVGNERMKLRVEFLGRERSLAFGSKCLEFGTLEKPELNVCKDIEINVDEEVMEPNVVI